MTTRPRGAGGGLARSHPAILAGAALALLASLAQAAPRLAPEDRTIIWEKDVAGWYVGVDPSVGTGCFIASSFEGGALLRLGIDRQIGKVYVFIGNENWSSIEPEKPYEIMVQMDRQKAWGATAAGVVLSGVPGVLFTTENPKFIAEIGRRYSLFLFYGETQIAGVDLAGSAAALREMLECQVAMREAGPRRPPSDDPFAEDESPPEPPGTVAH